MHLVAPFLVLLVVRRAQGRVGRHRKLLPVAHEIVKGEFIVHFASDATLAQLVHELDDLQVSKVYKGFPGAHVVGADSSTLERMLKSPLVELVEHNEIVPLLDNTFDEKENFELPGVFRSLETPEIITQDTRLTDTIRLTNLDRIDQRVRPLTDTYTYPSGAGAGVDVYVVDSGVRLTHKDFEGRASCGWSYNNDGCEDLYGHGTHVAATIAGRVVGVAKRANIIAVKVTGETGKAPNDRVIAGIEWACQAILVSGRPSLINMSLDWTMTQASINAVINGCVASGIPFVVSAGNKDQDACNSSPGSSLAIVVGATDAETDIRWDWSNFGSCISVYAVGRMVLSAGYDGDTRASYKSGTSNAAPQVAGAVALFLEAYPHATHWDAMSYIMSSSTRNRLFEPDLSLMSQANRFLYVELIPAGLTFTQPPADAPTTAPTPKLEQANFCNKKQRRKRCKRHGQCCSGKCEASKKNPDVKRCR